MNKAETERNYSQPNIVEDDNKTNYSPWVLGRIGVVSLIAGLVWYLVKKTSSLSEKTKGGEK